MLPGSQDEISKYYDYIVDFIGTGDSHIESMFSTHDVQIREDVDRQQPKEWPSDLFAPYDEDTTYQLLQDLKQPNVFVWRVLVQPHCEIEVAEQAVAKNREARTRIFSHSKVKGVVYVLPHHDSTEIDSFFESVSGSAVRRTFQGLTVKEPLSITETKILLFKQEVPTEPMEGNIVRIHGDSSYENLLAFVVKVEMVSQVAHLLALSAPYEYVGNKSEYGGFPYARIPKLATKDGQLAHDGRMHAFGLVRGELPFDCLRCRNICPTMQEIEALEQCPYDPVQKAVNFYKRNQVFDGDLVRVVHGEYQGLMAWADDLRRESCGIMAIPTALASDTFGIEVATEDLLRRNLKKGEEVLVIGGPFAGVKVKVVKYLDKSNVHATVVKPSETLAQVQNWEIIKIVDVGDYVEVEGGPYTGCRGYMGADQWQSGRVFVDGVVEKHLGDCSPMTFLNSWIDVSYHDLKAIRQFQTIAPRTSSEDESGSGSFPQVSLVGMEVYVVYHRFLKGTQGRIVSSLIKSKRGKNRLVYNISKLRDNSSNTYQVREHHLRELFTGLPIVAAARWHGSKWNRLEETRESTPPIVEEEEQSTFDFLEYAFREQDRFAVDALDQVNHCDETAVPDKAIAGQPDQYGAWILDERLMHKKLEVHISGTNDLILFREGQFEGKNGYLVVTSRIRDVETSVYVKIDSIAREPMTRIPVKYLSPKDSRFTVGTRVVIIGETTEPHDRETWIGSYGVVGPCPYDLDMDCRMVYILPSGPYVYVAVDSLCPSGNKAEWQGYTY